MAKEIKPTILSLAIDKHPRIIIRGRRIHVSYRLKYKLTKVFFISFSHSTCTRPARLLLCWPIITRALILSVVVTAAQDYHRHLLSFLGMTTQTLKMLWLPILMEVYQDLEWKWGLLPTTWGTNILLLNFELCSLVFNFICSSLTRFLYLMLLFQQRCSICPAYFKEWTLSNPEPAS